MRYQTRFWCAASERSRDRLSRLRGAAGSGGVCPLDVLDGYVLPTLSIERAYCVYRCPLAPHLRLSKVQGQRECTAISPLLPPRVLRAAADTSLDAEGRP